MSGSRPAIPRVFAIGDAVRLGLLTEAIGAGRMAARTIDDLLQGREETYDQLPAIDPATGEAGILRSAPAPLRRLLRPVPPSAPPAAPAGTAASAKPSARRRRFPEAQLEEAAYEYVVDDGPLHRLRFLRRGLPLRDLAAH